MNGRPTTLSTAQGPIAARRSAISEHHLVTTVKGKSQGDFPLIFVPQHLKVDLSVWARGNLEAIKDCLQGIGAALFRGFSVRTQKDFDDFLDSVGMHRMEYLEGATPRTQIGQKIYTSTEFPPEHPIAQHNELSYARTWPMRISFCCLVPPSQGGATPIADVRRVLGRLHHEIVEEFRAKQWMLVRNYRDGFGLAWQKVFHTNSPEDVEKYCAQSNIQCEWCADGTLRTRQIRRAIATHPITAEEVWFNHVAFWHHSSLDKNMSDLFLKEFGEKGLPYNTYFGDGSKIPDATIRTIRRAYDDVTHTFAWELGDVLLMDNMLVSHGRQTYRGPRQIIVSMGDPQNASPISAEDLI